MHHKGKPLQQCYQALVSAVGQRILGLINVILFVLIRASQYDLEGMSDTWTGSFLGGDVPQLDGAADDDSDGIEDFKLPRGKGRKGKSRKRSNQADNMRNKSDISTRKENFQRKPVDSKASDRIMEHGKTEKDGESNSLSMNVWPQKSRAIRTYSRRDMSISKRRKSPPLKEGEKAVKKDKEDLTVVEEVDEEKKEECKDEFRLVLSESSDSEDNITNKANLGSKQNETVGFQKNISLTHFNISKRNTSSPRKDKGTSGECSIRGITKYFQSPEKNSKRTRRQDEESSSSVENSSGSLKSFDEHSPAKVFPHCSKQDGGFSRKRTLRKRKLSEVNKKERKNSQGVMRKTNQDTGLVRSLSVVSEAMTDLRVSLNDVSFTPILSSKFDDAQRRLRKRRENSRENFTLINQRLSSPARKEKLSETGSPVRVRKNEKSPLSKKRSSPKKKEERTKKYGTLPVVIEKSPKKNLAADNVVADTASLIEAKCLSTEQSSANRQSQVEPTFHSSLINRDSQVGTGRASSRSRARVSGLFSSRTVATASADGNKETPLLVPLSSRGLSLKSASSDMDKSRSEKGHALSLQRKGLKRKLKVDTKKGSQSATPKILADMVKKRKLSLTLKVDKSRFDLREEGASESTVTSKENYEEHKSVCEVKEDISSTQQVGLSIESDDTLLPSDRKCDLPLNRTLSDDIICIPSSPGDSDSNDGSPNRVDSSAAIAELLSTKSSDNLNEKSNASVSEERGRKLATHLNDLQLASHETFCPKEKDTELLANALFNMSFPSPLPCVEECYSPPCPSSPRDIKHDSFDLENQHNVLQEKERLSINSSIVEDVEDKVTHFVEQEGMLISSLSQVHQPACFSPVVVRLRDESSLLQMGPQLGETQTHFENTEYSDANVSIQLESKSTENGNSTDCFNKMADNKEKPSESKLSFDSSKTSNNSNLNTNVEYPSMDGSIIERRTDANSYSEFASVEDKIQGQNIELNNPIVDVTSRESATERTHLPQTSGTDKAELEEQNSTVSEEREFVLKLSIAEDNLTDDQPSIHSHQHISKMEICAYEENQAREILSESLDDEIALVLPKQPGDQSKNQICCTQGGLSVPSRSFLEGDRNSHGGREEVIAIEPLKRPPTSEELVKSLNDYGLPHCRYQEPFCSNPDDIPACPRLVTCLVPPLSCIYSDSIGSNKSIHKSQKNQFDCLIASLIVKSVFLK